MKQFQHDRWIESGFWLILRVAGFRQLLESIRPEATMQRLEFTLLTVFTVAMLPVSFLTSLTLYCKLLSTDFILVHTYSYILSNNFCPPVNGFSLNSATSALLKISWTRWKNNFYVLTYLRVTIRQYWVCPVLKINPGILNRISCTYMGKLPVPVAARSKA